jgi:hypothetical protein
LFLKRNRCFIFPILLATTASVKGRIPQYGKQQGGRQGEEEEPRQEEQAEGSCRRCCQCGRFSSASTGYVSGLQWSSNPFEGRVEKIAKYILEFAKKEYESGMKLKKPQITRENC